jgi:hypothetical protein
MYECKKMKINVGNKDLHSQYLNANERAHDILITLNYIERKSKVELTIGTYEAKYISYGYDLIEEQNMKQELYENMKSIETSLKEMYDEKTMKSEYEKKYTKYHTERMLKEMLEKIINVKISKYNKEKRIRIEMEKLFIEDNKFIISKRLGS